MNKLNNLLIFSLGFLLMVLIHIIITDIDDKPGQIQQLKDENQRLQYQIFKANLHNQCIRIGI